MGTIEVYGESNALSLSGGVFGLAVDDITLDNGDLDLTVTAQGGAASDSVDRLAFNAASTYTSPTALGAGTVPGTIGDILVESGAIVSNSTDAAHPVADPTADRPGALTADNGIGTITQSGSPGMIDIQTVNGNAIGSAAAVNSPIGAISSTGSIWIKSYNNIGSGTAFSAAQDTGAINADDSISVETLSVGGDMGNIIVTRNVGSTSGYVYLPAVQVNGSVGIIQSGLLADSIPISGASWTQTGLILTDTGAFTSYTWSPTDTIIISGGAGVTTGVYTVASRTGNDTITLGSSIDGSNTTGVTGTLLDGDNVLVNGTIGGDPTWINAGDATAHLALTILNAVRSTAGSAAPPLVLVTQGDGVTAGSATDYVVSLSGTWTESTPPSLNPPTMDLTLTFSGGGTTDSLGNGVTINDMNGVTSLLDTVLSIATRPNPTDADNISPYAITGLGAKATSPSYLGPIFALFNLDGFQDSYVVESSKGRNDFEEILIEGNLEGSIGGPGASLATDSANTVVSSDAPILGNIGTIEIEGEWFNPSSPDTHTLRSGQIFVLSIGQILYGSLANYKIPDDAFSYEAVEAASSPNNPSYTGVAASVGRDGFWHDLEDYSALIPLSGDDNVTVPPLGSVYLVFEGPTGLFETILLINDSPTVTDTFDLVFDPGYIADIYLYGQQLAMKYNALDAADPATDNPTGPALTGIYYGVTHGVNTATEPNAPALTPFSSSTSPARSARSRPSPPASPPPPSRPTWATSWSVTRWT